MDASQPYNPIGLYRIAGTDEQADVSLASLDLTSEMRVRALPDLAHAPLNDLLAHLSVLELSHITQAIVRGEPFTVDQLDMILPRPGWQLISQTADEPPQYTLQQMGESAVHSGARRHLLQLFELVVRSALAPYIGEPSPRSWIERLRNVHPELRQALGDAARFEKEDIARDVR